MSTPESGPGEAAGQEAPEKTYEKEFGQETKFRIVTSRHAQKASGEVFAAEGGISASSISPQGKAEATQLGEVLDISIPPSGKGYGVRASYIDRTSETLEAIEAGFKQPPRGGDGERTRKIVRKVELLAEMPEAMWKIYERKFDINRDRVMARQGKNPKDFGKLTPDEQEKIAETAEEPIVEEWLFDKTSELYRLYPPEEAAASVAVLYANYVDMPELFYSGTEATLNQSTHKTTTEPLLKEILILPSGEKMISLQDIGGSLGTVDSWELLVETDEEENKKVQILMRRKKRGEEDKLEFEEATYDVDLERLEELAQMQIDKNNQERAEGVSVTE